MSDTFDDDRRLRTPAEGVRILGAEEVGGGIPEPPADDHYDDPRDAETNDAPQLGFDDLPLVDADDFDAEPAGSRKTQPAGSGGTQPAGSGGTQPAGSGGAWSGLRDETDEVRAFDAPWVPAPDAAHPDDLLPGHERARAAASVPPAPVARETPPAPADEVPVAPAPATAPVPGAETPVPATDTRAEPPTGEVPPLPHWTEPPTGAVPAIFADDDGADAEIDAWATVSGTQPRFRAEGSDWAESDFAEDLSGEHVKLGALSEEGPVDEEAAFARDLAEKRRGGRGRARTATARRPARTRTREVPLPEVDLAAREVAPARDLPTAIITGAAVAVVAIVCFMRGTGWTVGLSALVVGVATLELATTLQRRGIRPATPVALVASTMLPIAARHYGAAAYPVFFGMVVVVTMLWFLWEITPGRPLAGVAATVLLFGYVGGLGGFAGLLLASHDGVGLIFGVAVCVIAYDVFGFFVGSQFGRTAIAPRVSPNKTVEGTIAGMIAAIVVGAAIAGQVAPWTPGKGLVLGVLVAAGAFMGDLCESMLKRDLGVKDFGSLLPGHGGVLDRFDALLFCLPIAYYLALQFKIF